MSDETPLLSQADIDFASENTDGVQDAVTRLYEMSTFILERHGFQVNVPRTVESAVSAQGMSLETLCHHMLTSTTADWNKNPSFYSGIMLELTERCQLIQQVWSKEDQ